MRLFSDASERITDPFLRRAYLLAEKGRGTASPNPLVGCVLVRDGEVVGQAWHHRAGEAHAEVLALQQAGDRAQRATAYVTLEPCNHVGATGPCTEALRDSGVSTVVVGMRDPNPMVSGGGCDVLASWGIDVALAEDPAPFEEQNEAWLKYVTMGKPWVQAKVALSLDGHASLKQGERSRLSGDEARALTMRLRASADAVLIGAGTLGVDDPSLTVRDESDLPAAHQPLRAVLSRETVPPAGARIFTDGLGPAVFVTAEETQCGEVAARGVRIERYDSREGIDGALRALGGLGVTRVLVEAGPRLLESLWRAHQIDELVVYHTGGMAGASAPPLFESASHGVGGEVLRRMQAVEAGLAGSDAVTVWQACPGWVCEVERE